KIDELGGMVAAIEKQYPQREIANAAFQYQQEVDAKRKIIVGVNKYVMEDDEGVEILEIPEKIEKEQVANLNRVRKERDASKCQAALRTLKEKTATKENLIPSILDCVKTYATMGEII